MPTVSRRPSLIPGGPVPPRRNAKKLMDLPRKPFTFSAASPMAPGPVSLAQLVPRLATTSVPVTTTAPPLAEPTAPAPVRRRLLLGR